MRRLMALFLCAALLFVTPIAMAQEDIRENGGFQYVVQEDGTAKIVGLTDVTIENYPVRTQEITFPSWLDGHAVTSIGEDVLGEAYWVYSVTLPQTIVSISGGAFSEGYGVESIFVVPGNPVYESIGGVLYDKTKKLLHSYPTGRESDRYSIRKGTTVIGEYAFYDCWDLETVELPMGLLEIGDSAFSGCSNLSELSLPEGLQRIGGEAFYECDSLTAITIPAGVTAIGPKAFALCRELVEFQVAQENPVYSQADGVLFDENGRRLLAYPGSRKNEEYIVPQEVEAISEEAFAQTRNLKKVVIPEGTIRIGTAAFVSCFDLAEMEVAEGNNFYHDDGGVLFDTAARRLEAYPAGRENTTYEIPEGTLAIGDKAFAFCARLQGVTIPDSVTSLGEEAFYQCNGLARIILPARVTGIGIHAFADCYSLESVTLADGVKEIGEGAFFSCSSLYDISLPVGLESIGSKAFGWCWGLAGVSVPASVSKIEEEAFLGCEQLILEVMQGSFALAYAQKNNLLYTIHPNWLK